MANPPIIGKTLSRVGAPLVRLAKTLAQDAQRVGIPGKYRILNGFLLRGVKMHNRYVGQVLDLPGLVLLAGTGQGIINELVTVGNRDDFTDPGTSGTHVVSDLIGGDRVVSPTPPVPDSMVDVPPQPLLIAQVQPQLQGQLWYMGQLRIRLSAPGSFLNLDTFGTLTYAKNIGVGCSVTVIRDSISPYSSFLQGYKPNYMALNAFWVEESNLPSGWSVLPRRLVSAGSYGVADPYRVDIVPKSVTCGAAVNPAADMTGTDQYCLAFAGIKQNRTTWTGGGFTYYDRFGLGALIVARGSYNRTSFVSGTFARATLASVTTVLSASMPITQMRPTPATYPGASGGPNLDTPSWFLAPAVARYTGGFAKFCVHWAPYYDTGTSTRFTSFGVVVLTDSNTISVPKADMTWTYPNTPPIAGSDSTKMLMPWIAGTASVERIVATVPQRTAYCLVWEQWLSRNAATHAGGFTTTTQWPTSYEMGGQWALYAVSSAGAVSRTVITATCAPLFSPSMFEGGLGNDSSAGRAGPPNVYFPPNLRYGGGALWYAPDTSFSSLYQMAPEKLVTACIPTGYFRTWAQLDPSTSAFLSGYTRVTTHNVSCAVLDLTTNTFEIRGVIVARDWADQYCHITVVQPEVPAVGLTPLIPAVLLATMRIAIRSGAMTQPADKTYLSIDGGWTWREYITDAAGGNGSFLVGNQLWAIDANGRFDTDPFGA
ncbi:hypothetical protein [Pseudomonas mediterranea]|uniref:hypothetical protein n=1 Tax=Pseudomonas mediterranea TaxID=183795 RepID=UPI0006D8B9F4|nr:hypothetical protein [Pseudomonas mediterranea]